MTYHVVLCVTHYNNMQHRIKHVTGTPYVIMVRYYTTINITHGTWDNALYYYIRSTVPAVRFCINVYRDVQRTLYVTYSTYSFLYEDTYITLYNIKVPYTM